SNSSSGISARSSVPQDPAQPDPRQQLLPVAKLDPKVIQALGYLTRPYNEESKQAPRAAPSSDELDTQREALIRHNQREKEGMREIVQQQIRSWKRRLQYSDPRMDQEVERTWPLLEYAKRRTEGMPMVFFDISRDPTLLSSDSIRIVLEDGQEASRPLVEEYMHLEFSPTTRFTMLTLKCEQSELDNWDVVIQRPDGIRIMDIFEEIFRTYNVPLTPKEYYNQHQLAASSVCQQAFFRRASHNPDLMDEIGDKGMSRIDLMADRTLFNGTFFNADIRQYHFQLLQQHSEDIGSSRLY
ncbi:hypothetical protein H0H87_001482, partial [Tephrocybe sp. NHM501043]